MASRAGWAIFALIGAAGSVFIALQPASPQADPATYGTLHTVFWIAAAALGFVALMLMNSSGAGAPPTASQTTNLEALYEPGEATVYRSEWSYDMTESWWENEVNVAKSLIVGYDVVDGNQKSRSWTVNVTLALTHERLYLVWFKGSKVTEFQTASLASLAGFQWAFDKTKTTTGVHTGYTFSFSYPRAGQLTTWSLRSTPQVAEPFIEHFKAAMARYTALAAPVDMAAQLRALQGLVNDGIITADEMRRAKELFLGRAPDQRQVMERNLRSLYELRKSGVLNQIEFDIKKQDILATTK